MGMEIIIAYLVANGPTLISLLTSLIGVFAIVASMTPNTTDDKVVQVLLTLINKFGFNFGNAKNE